MKNGKKKAPKLKAKTPTPLNDRLATARKLGERQETITETLSPSQVEGEREKVCVSLREIDVIDEKLKSISADLKARKTELKARVAEALRTANAAKRDVEITVEEWLTPQNEVIRMRADTSEIIGNRTARMEELQEELFEEDEDDDDPELSAEIAESAADSKEAGDEEFGAS